MAINVGCESPRSSMSDSTNQPLEGQGTWTPDEHDRFLYGISLYPKGPWKKVAAIVKTRTSRQTQTHAQKHKEKLARHTRGLRSRAPVVDELAVYHPMLRLSSVPHRPRCFQTFTRDTPSALNHELPSFEESIDFLLDEYLGPKPA
ncbi:Aste57867_19552 [Aphanomyces stellatus]|nr:hypothetical protein As57867_019488 [Aphanomyces stellatus]VFT96258.1 Aste57867_19552 [Aphanomyces stellatus]